MTDQKIVWSPTRLIPALFWGTLAAVLAFAASLAAQENKVPQPETAVQPKRPYTISKETTYFTGPLKPDGSIDFIVAVNEHFSQGVTAENNAARIIVPLIPMMGWTDEEQRGKVLVAMGLDPVGQDSQTIVPAVEFVERRQWNSEALKSNFATACTRAWWDNEFPDVLAWLQENELALAKIREAAHCERYYVPLVSNGNSEDVISALLDDVVFLRFVSRLLAARANNHLANERWDAAWSDIATILQIGRLVGQGQSWVHSSASTHIVETGSAVAARFINAAPLKADNWEKLLESWILARITRLADQTRIQERAIYVQTIIDQWTSPERHIGKADDPAGEPNRPPQRIAAEAMREMIERKEVEIDEMLRLAQPYYERASQIFDHPDPGERNALATEIENEIDEMSDKGAEFFWPRLDASSHVTASQSYAKLTLGILFPSIPMLLRGQSRNQASRQVIALALAARAFQSKFGELPGSLDDLKSQVDSSTMVQPFDDQPFGFRKTDDALVIYHWGTNGRDDGGDIDGDDPKDWGVRIAK